MTGMPARPPIIAIDGPSGAGKGTVARTIAGALGYRYVDTGAMYRAVALRALREGTPAGDGEALRRMALETKIDVICGPTHTRVLLDGEDVSEAIRGMAVSRLTGDVARQQAIRDLLVAKQRETGRKLGSFVAEGRDQGSVVFPDADLKVVMDAALERRAKRRHLEMLADGEDVRLHDILQNLDQRDSTDSHQWAPLLRDPRVVRIDTSRLTISQVVDQLAQELERRRADRPCK